MEKEHGHQHDPDRGGIEKDCGSREGHHVDRGEIAGGKEQYTSHTQPEEKRKIPDRDVKARRDANQLDQAESDCGQREPDGGDLNWGKTKGGESADKNTHTAPENTCQDDQCRTEERRVYFFHVSRHLLCISRSPTEQNRGGREQEYIITEGNVKRKLADRTKQGRKSKTAEAIEFSGEMDYNSGKSDEEDTPTDDTVFHLQSLCAPEEKDSSCNEFVRENKHF